MTSAPLNQKKVSVIVITNRHLLPQTVIIPTKTQLFVSLAKLENKTFIELYTGIFLPLVVSPGDNWIHIQFSWDFF